MKKLLIYSFFCIILLSLVTWFGPWDVYHVPQAGDGFGGTVGVGKLPVWIGEVLTYTNGAYTLEESREKDRLWLENNPEYKEIYYIDEWGSLRFRRKND